MKGTFKNKKIYVTDGWSKDYLLKLSEIDNEYGRGVAWVTLENEMAYPVVYPNNDMGILHAIVDIEETGKDVIIT